MLEVPDSDSYCVLVQSFFCLYQQHKSPDDLLIGMLIVLHAVSFQVEGAIQQYELYSIVITKQCGFICPAPIVVLHLH